MDPRTVAIIQARMGSQRLPGKSMADLAGEPLLWQFLERVKRCKNIDQVVLATTSKTQDDVLVKIADRCNVQSFRGAENDLVDRYYQAAKLFNADIVVRICADNPVVEPTEVDRIIDYHKNNDSDFSSNTHNIMDNMYPDGLGAEVFDFATLEELTRLTDNPENREHPHSYFYEHPEKYKIGTVPCPKSFQRPDLKLDVNTAEELKFLQAIYEYWYKKDNHFHIENIIWWYDNIWKKNDS
jgi:spore coat polysaccharide biosynthesis protein SpsF